MITLSFTFCDTKTERGKKRPVQSTFEFPKKKPKWLESWLTATKLLVEMCARDLRPLSIVNGTGFRNYVHCLDPTYVVPSHTTMKNYTNYYYDSLKKNVSSELQSQTSLAFTTDTWTSCVTEGYLTLTVHFIDNLWQIRNYVLATIEVKDHHTGENLANEIKDIV